MKASKRAGRNVPKPSQFPEVYDYLTRLASVQADLVLRTLSADESASVSGQPDGFLLYCDSLTDQKQLSLHVIAPLLAGSGEEPKDLISVGGIRESDDLRTVLEAVMKGDTALFRPNRPAAVISVRHWPKRNVPKPELEPGAVGPHEGFTEVLADNLGLLRRRLPDPRLRVERSVVGPRTRTEVVLVYLPGVADAELVAEVRRRLATKQNDDLLDVSSLVLVLEDPVKSLTPTVQKTERPDTVARACLEGRVAVMCQGSVQAVVVPGLFFHHLQAPDDYYIKPSVVPGLRFLRWTALNMALFLPSVYVALVAFHPEAIPTQLLVGLIAAREGVPFPVVVEALVMTTTFELFREAGLRLPRPLGYVIPIVGGLVIGEAAIRANLASPTVVIVVALTAIAGFAIPSPEVVSTFLYAQYLTTVLAGVLGFFGVFLGYLFVGIYLNWIQPYGFPFLSPLTPLVPRRLAEVFGFPVGESNQGLKPKAHKKTLSQKRRRWKKL